MSDGPTPITQVDREAVNAFHSASFTAMFGNGSDKKAFSGGLNTAHTLLLEAFAAHRIAAERETVERIVEWLRESAAWHEKHDDGLSGFGHISLGQTEAADAIEEGDWRND